MVSTGKRHWDNLLAGHYTDKQAITLKQDRWDVSPWFGTPSRSISAMLGLSLKAPYVTVIANHIGGTLDGQEKPGVQRASYVNLFSPQDHIIICDSNNKGEHAPNPPKLFWSDVIFALWKQECEKAKLPPSSLKYIVRKHVINKITQDIVAHAYKTFKSGTPSFEAETWLPNGDTKDVFLALLGSPNGSGVARLLLEHVTELGRKTIASVTTVSHPDSPGPFEGSYLLDIIWNLVDAPAPIAASGQGTHGEGSGPVHWADLH